MPSPLPILSSARQRRPPPPAAPGASSPTPPAVAGPELTRGRIGARPRWPGRLLASCLLVTEDQLRQTWPRSDLTGLRNPSRRIHGEDGAGEGKGRGLLHAAVAAEACRGDGGGKVQVLSRAAATDPGVSHSLSTSTTRRPSAPAATCTVGPSVAATSAWAWRNARRRLPTKGVGIDDTTHVASLLALGARPRGAVTSYMAGLSHRQLRELLDALDQEDATLMEHAKREFAGLSTLIEQVWVLLDMAWAPGAAAGCSSPPDPVRPPFQEAHAPPAELAAQPRPARTWPPSATELAVRPPSAGSP
ncbi:uncharacterized protein [Miscanthus floridulus]|uniref:uncharacterized protein n=1 Tax=Miscanthus floridulus TaxID=154761 RepID=UPI0034589EFA